MPYVIRTHVVAVDVNTTKLFAEAGIVGRWTGLVTREVTAATRVHVPINKRVNKSRRNAAWSIGSLNRSIRGKTDRTGPHSRDMTIYSDVPYAKWVNNGTFAIAGRPEMYLPPNAGFGGVFSTRDTNPLRRPGLTNFRVRTEEGDWHRVVSGQRAVSFFERGYEDARKVHPQLGSLQSGIAGSARHYI